MPLHGRPRGYALILVLTLLSVLLILALSLSYTSRLELAATENFARGVQGRFAALSSLPVAAGLFARDEGATHFLQPWATGGILEDNSRPNSSLEEADVQVILASTLPIREDSGNLVQMLQGMSWEEALAMRGQEIPDVPGRPSPSRVIAERSEVHIPGYGMAHIRVQDESGKLDINVAGTLASNPRRVVADSAVMLNLRDFVEQALDEAGLDTTRASTIARAIVLYRLGADSAPGIAGVDDDGDSDAGDRVNDDTEQETDSHTPVVSAVLELDGRDNDADGIVDEESEGVDEPDERSLDPRVTARGDDRMFLCVEDLLRVPVITPEVFAALAPHVTIHSASETRAPAVGDEVSGELVNVNEADFDELLAHLEAHFEDQPSELLAQYALNLIDSRDTDHIPSTAPGAQFEDLLGLELTPMINEVWPDSETAPDAGDDGQYVELLNPWAIEIDLEDMFLQVGGLRFALHGTMQPGAMMIITDDYDESLDPDPEDDVPGYGSFVEIFDLYPNGGSRMLLEDPALDLPDVGGKVELVNAEGAVLDRFAWGGTGQGTGRRVSHQRDDPRVRASEVRLCTPWERNLNSEPPVGHMTVYGEIVPFDRPFATPADLMFVHAGWTKAVDPGDRGWRFPEIYSEDLGSIDSRVVDIFSVGPLVRADADTDEDAEEDTVLTSGIEWALGRVNINTATRPVLRALPGMTEELATAILNWRAQVELMWYTDPDVREAPFTRRGDLLRNEFIWRGTDLRDRLLRYRQMVNAVTTSSATLCVEATAANEPGRRTPSTAPRSLVSCLEVRGGKVSVVSLDFLEGH